MATQPAGGLYAFGPFRLDTGSRVLSCSGQPLALAPKTFDLLLLLVENHGRVLTKAQLMGALWQEAFVEEANLSFQVSTLRKALGEEGAAWIETAPKVGYRFVGPVERPAVAAPEPAPISETARRGRRWSWIAAPFFVLALVIVAAWWPAKEISTPAAPAFQQIPLTSYDGVEREPSFSSDGSQVAFAWDGETQDNFDIYVKALGASRPLRLTKDPATDCMPAWSPDALRIAFHREGQGIFLVAPTGGPERKLLSLSSGCAQLSWSADGKHLSFSRPAQDGEPGGIFLMRVEDGSIERLTRAEPSTSSVAATNRVNNHHRGAALSPDGESLAFIACSPGSAGCDILLLALDDQLKARGSARHLLRLPYVETTAWTADGRALVFPQGNRLLKVSVGPETKPETLLFAPIIHRTPTISRVGDRMAYSRETEAQGGDIWKLDQNGALTRSPMSSTLHEQHPQFSPDGKRVTFNSRRTGRVEVWVANADGTGVAPLTNTWSGTGRWSPDGRQIVYDAVVEEKWDVHVVDAGGGPPTPVVRHPGIDAIASFSRDGKWIYFYSDRDGRPEIYRTPSKGGPVVRLTENGGHVALESLDGKFIFYTKANTVCGVPLFVRSLEGGPERRVLDSLCSRGFEVTERGIYYVDKSASDDRVIVGLLDPQSGKSTEVRKSSRPLYGLDHRLTVSPDGNTILVSGSAQRPGADLYLVENFR